MKSIVKESVMKLLALAAVFWPFEKVESAQNSESGIKSQAELTYFNNLEQDGDRPLYYETCLLPKVEKDDKKVGFEGCYWRFGDTKGNVSDWWRLASHVNFENEDFRLRLGRVLVREYAGYVYCPTTPRFDNISTAKGVGVGLTGINFEHKSSGFGFGVASSNNQMNPSDWDTGYLTWHKELCDEFAVQAHIGGTRSELTRAGLTAKWKPRQDVTIVGEAIYKDKEMSEFLTAGWQITDNLKAFGGFEVTHPDQGKATGLATAGLDYHLGKSGVHIFAGVHQEVGGERTTSAVVGLRFQGTIKAAKDKFDCNGF